jgi:hypothetical protein
MKGGANLEDQVAISRAVVYAAENNDGILDVPVLAASLDIPLDCCQSYVDFYANKHSVTLFNPVEKINVSAAAPASAASSEAESEENGDFFQ